MFRYWMLPALVAWSAWFGAASAAPCDRPAPVRLAAGANLAEITGGIARGEVACFRIAGRQDQRMTVSQPDDPDTNIVMQIYRPPWRIVRSAEGIRVRGHALEGAAEGDDAKSWAGTLPATGTYLLVFGTTWGGGDYHIRIAIR